METWMISLGAIVGTVASMIITMKVSLRYVNKDLSEIKAQLKKQDEELDTLQKGHLLMDQKLTQGITRNELKEMFVSKETFLRMDDKITILNDDIKDIKDILEHKRYRKKKAT